MTAILLAALLGLQDDADVAAAIDKFKAGFKSSSPSQRAAAVGELGQTPHAKTLALLVPLLTSDLPPTRIAAAKALEKFVDQKKTVIPALQHALAANASEPGVMITVLGALAEIADASVMPTVQKYFYEKDARVARKAVQVAGALPAASSIDPLIDLSRRQEKIAKNNSASGTVLAGGDVNGNNKVVAKSDENALKAAQDLVAEIDKTLTMISGETLAGSQQWQTWWNQAKGTFKIQK